MLIRFCAATLFIATGPIIDARPRTRATRGSRQHGLTAKAAQAARQPGSQAARQPGSQAARQPSLPLHAAPYREDGDPDKILCPDEEAAFRLHELGVVVFCWWRFLACLICTFK